MSNLFASKTDRQNDFNNFIKRNAAIISPEVKIEDIRFIYEMAWLAGAVYEEKRQNESLRQWEATRHGTLNK